MSSTTLPYTKIYTVKINRIASESNRWYYKHKGELFDCVIVTKENHLKKISPTFLVLNNEDGVLDVPIIYKTIRQLDCTIISERIIDSRPVYDFIENYNSVPI